MEKVEQALNSLTMKTNHDKISSLMRQTAQSTVEAICVYVCRKGNYV